MSDNETEDKKPSKPLGLRRGGSTETGRVRQSFSHGRSKTVVVEKKRAKRGGKADEGTGTSGSAVDTSKLRKPAGGRPDGGRDGPPRSGRSDGGGKGRGGKPAVHKALSDEEYSRRVKALEAAKKAELARKKALAEAEAKRAADAAKQAEADKAAAEEAAKQAAEAKASEDAAAKEAAAKAKADAGDQAAPQDDAPKAEPAAAKAEAAKSADDAKAAPKAAQAAEAAAPAEATKPKPKAAAKPAAKTEAAKAAEAAAEKANAETEARAKRRREDASVKTGDAVDISALTSALPGPKIISRAAPKPKEPEPSPGPADAAAPAPRSRPRPGSDGAAPSAPARPGGGRPGARTDRDDRTPRNTRSAGDAKRRSGKLTITQATSGDLGGRTRSVAAMRRRQERERRKQGGEPAQKVYREVKIPDVITVQELSNRMTERSGEVIKSLMKMDMMVTLNESIDADTAQLVVEEFGHKAVRVSEADVENVIDQADDPIETQLPRAPIVTIMGHVDHGKTSLLDKLRNANVVAGEAGGITQHIGAYQVKTDSGVVSFLDTPGHAAFTAMRARGANATDIVILVVAADDSVMPQTIEAISHAKAANVPMIVAINKIDKPAADANKVRTELLQHDVQVEGMGGEVLDVEVSALTGEGLDKLLENIILQAEILDLKARPDRDAEGIVVEAQLDVGRGPVATVLVQRGTLKVGDIFVAGEQWGKVRALIDDHGKRIKEAGPSVPVEVLGLNGTPEAGDTLFAVENEKRAEEIAEYRERSAKEKRAIQGTRTLDQMLAQAKADETTSELPVVVKADVQGSNEAIMQALDKIGNDEVRVRILHSGVGAITESDVTLAEASGAAIIGFNVRANSAAREASNQKGVEIRYYSVIYDLVDDVKAAATGLLSPEIKETFIGYAEILEVFRITGVGNVAGCRITEGVARRSAGVRLLRDNVVIHEGKLKTLKRFKDEVKEVTGGQECGMAFERYEDMRAGDVIEIFETSEVERTLD